MSLERAQEIIKKINVLQAELDTILCPEPKEGEDDK